MPLALRQRHDAPTAHDSFSDFAVRRETDAALLAAVLEKQLSEIERRLNDGHRAYVAWWAEAPVAWGWVATRSAEIGELDSAFTLPEGDRYLWNFVTAPSQRGRGFYPRLLDAIIAIESAEAERFWIAYAPENHASGAGIRKAGFTTVAELSFDGAGQPAIRALADGAEAAARMLGLPLASEELAPCWHCTRQPGNSGAACRGGECTCDYQKLRSVRAA